MARILLVGSDLVVANAVLAEAGYMPPPGFVGIASETAAVGDVFDPVTGLFSSPVVSVLDRRAARLQAVQAMRQRLMDRGAPFGGKRIEMDDATRANLSGMAVTAILVLTGALPEWPASYALGWITLDNTRIALPTPQAGITLAASVAGWYSGLVQYARDAKDAVLTAEDPDMAWAALNWSTWAA
jgi:hypothetical protein